MILAKHKRFMGKTRFLYKKRLQMNQLYHKMLALCSSGFTVLSLNCLLYDKCDRSSVDHRSQTKKYYKYTKKHYNIIFVIFFCLGRVVCRGSVTFIIQFVTIAHLNKDKRNFDVKGLMAGRFTHLGQRFEVRELTIEDGPALKARKNPGHGPPPP